MKSNTKKVKEHWSKTAIVYQIYPRSFKDNNNDGIGDLNGIIEKLDYLNDGTKDSLGIDAIWLSPIYKSPMADFGYDISDYYDIDSIFGNLNTFEKLISEAHKRNIKVIMDFVANHTSSRHPWFVESSSSKHNPKRDWYIWKDPKPDGSPPNNWISEFGGSAWKYDKKTGQYYLHKFLSQQPDLNWFNPKVVKEIKNVLRYWVKKGVDGFRLDAIAHLAKDEQFRDDPPNPDYIPGKDNPHKSLLHVNSRSNLDVIPIIEEFCNVIGKENFMVGEISPTLEELANFYQACVEKIHIPFNFNLIDLPWNAKAFQRFIDTYDQIIGPDNLSNYVLGNHDQPRVSSRIGKDKARVAAMLLFTLRGMPFIYYGEELGMEDAKIPLDKILDPPGKNLAEFKAGRDPERTPMQWNKKPNAGFSKRKPWLPVNKNYQKINVESELVDARSMLILYRKLIHYRKSSQALLKGSYHSLDAGDSSVFYFLRKLEGEKVLILLNFSAQNKTVSLNFSKAKVIVNTYLDKDFGAEIDSTNFSLRPNEGYALEIIE